MNQMDMVKQAFSNGSYAIDSYRLYCGDFLCGTELVAFTYPSEETDVHNKEILRRTLQGYDWVYIAVDLGEEHALVDACECADLLRTDNANTRTELFCVILEKYTETPVAEVLLEHYNKVFFVQHPTQMSIPVEMVRAVGNGRNMVGADYADFFSVIVPHKHIHVVQEKSPNANVLEEATKRLKEKLRMWSEREYDASIPYENAAVDMGPFHRDTKIVYNLSSAAAQIYIRIPLTAEEEARLIAALESIEGVADVFNRAELDALNTPANLGDFVVDCAVGYAFSTSVAEHGSRAQQHTFMVYYGPGIRAGYLYTTQCWNVDIVPTILHLNGLPIPETVDGIVLDGILVQTP